MSDRSRYSMIKPPISAARIDSQIANYIAHSILLERCPYVFSKYACDAKPFNWQINITQGGQISLTETNLHLGAKQYDSCSCKPHLRCKVNQAS